MTTTVYVRPADAPASRPVIVRAGVVTVAGAGGDMTAGVYDPQGIAGDAFDRAVQTGEQPVSSVAGLQVSLDAKLAASAFTKAAVDALGINAATLEGSTLAQVQSAVTAAIVDASPATLDTLNELAAALGDDPNFATTIANALAGKAPTSHGTHVAPDTVGVAELSATGTADATTVLHGDNTWKTVQGAPVRQIFETALGVWTADASAERTARDPRSCIEFVGVTDPTDATNGIGTPANILAGDSWTEVADFI